MIALSLSGECVTTFVAKFSNPNKIAWIHCDYSRIFTNKMYEFAVFSKYCKL